MLTFRNRFGVFVVVSLQVIWVKLPDESPWLLSKSIDSGHSLVIVGPLVLHGDKLIFVTVPFHPHQDGVVQTLVANVDDP